MDNTKKVPVLRFPEFSGEWEVKKLGNETIWNSGGTPSKQISSYWDGDIPWISASSMRGLKYFDSDLKITNEGLLNGSKLALKDSLLLLVRGSMLFNKIPVGIAIKDVAFNQDVKSIRPKESIKPYFLLYWFIASEHKLLNMVSGTGIGAGKLDTQHLLAMDFQIPEIPEQTKIADFLTQIDNKINQLSQKKQLLERYKQGVMQQIFSQEIRFTDDDGREFPEWEEKKIGSISDKITAGGTPSTLKIEYWNGDIRWMNSGELNLKKVYEVENRITRLGLNNSSTKIIPSKCILIGLAGQGKTRGTVAMNMIELCTNQSIASIYPKPEIFNEEFLYHNLDFRYDELRGLSTGDGGRGGLNLQIIKSMPILLPCLKEQTKIANFLTALDEKIALVEKQLHGTKQYKKGLLQQLFV